MNNRRQFLRQAFGLTVGLAVLPDLKTKAVPVPMTATEIQDRIAERMGRANEERKRIEGMADEISGLFTPPDVKWFSLKLKPEHENIPGAREWAKSCEDMMNTPEMIQKFKGEVRKAYEINLS